MSASTSTLTVNRLRLEVHLGAGDEERATLQPIEVSLQLHFPEIPAACTDDDSDFICYDKLCTVLKELVAGRQFRLLEYLTMQMFGAVRAEVDEKIKLWIKVDKLQAPVEGLQGGTSFIHSDIG